MKWKVAQAQGISEEINRSHLGHLQLRERSKQIDGSFVLRIDVSLPFPTNLQCKRLTKPLTASLHWCTAACG